MVGFKWRTVVGFALTEKDSGELQMENYGNGL